VRADALDGVGGDDADRALAALARLAHDADRVGLGLAPLDRTVYIACSRTIAIRTLSRPMPSDSSWPRQAAIIRGLMSASAMSAQRGATSRRQRRS
jgi:hypothetical protein